MYKLTKDEYNHLLDNAVTATLKSTEKKPGYYKQIRYKVRKTSRYI